MGALLAVLFFWGFIGGLVGLAIGSSKGRSTEGFWLGLSLGVIGWIIVAVMEPADAVRTQRNRELAAALGSGIISDASPVRRPCPWCAELILPAAVVCRFCGRDVEPVIVNEPVVGPVEEDHSAEYPEAARLYPMQFERAYEQLVTLGDAPADPDAWLRFVCHLIQGGWEPARASARAVRGPLW